MRQPLFPAAANPNQIRGVLARARCTANFGNFRMFRGAAVVSRSKVHRWWPLLVSGGVPVEDHSR